jgi:beta-1,4-mannosyl-glycoprotein beta-1,4-N-acetylglucosaminyltransferase
MFYYKFNLKLSNFKWTGSKACKMKKLISPQWLRNIKDKKFAFYRFDTFFSSTKYRNLKFIEDGGWHYTNMKNAKEIEHKLRSYLHHQEFEANHINLEQIEKIIKSKKAIYDVNSDKRQGKFGEGPQLIKINSDEIPNYLKNNPQIYSKWLD